MSQRIFQSRSVLIIISAAGAAILTRLFLFVFPSAGGSPILGLHIHHSLIGILLVCMGGIPAALLQSEKLLRSLAVVVFGVGLGLSLDEWLLFVLREAVPSTPYMSPWSVAGAAIFVSLVVVYTLIVGRFAEAPKKQ